MSNSQGLTQVVAVVAAAVVGFYSENPYYAAMTYTAITGVGNAINPPKGPNLVGPRLLDLSQQGASYGVIIPRIYGSVAMLGNIFWIENNQLKEISKTTSSGGKGGGSKSQTTTYSYSATFALGLCEGPIAGVRRIWISGNLVYDAGSNDLATVMASNKLSSGFTLYTGSETQQPNPRMQSTIGVADTPAFRGLAYIVFEDLALEKYGNTLLGAQIKVEVLSVSTSPGVILKQTSLLSGAARPSVATALNCSDTGLMSVFKNNSVNGVADPVYNRTNFSISTNTELEVEQLSFGTSIANCPHFDGWSDRVEVVHISASQYISCIGPDTKNNLSFPCPLLVGFNSSAMTYFKRGQKRLLFHSNYISLVAYSDVYEISASGLNLIKSFLIGSVHGACQTIFVGENYNYGFTTNKFLVAYDKDWNEVWAVDMSAEVLIATPTLGVGSNQNIIREISAAGFVVINNQNRFWKVSASGYQYLGSVSTGFLFSFMLKGGSHCQFPLWSHYNADTNTVYSVNLEALANTTLPLSSIVQAEVLKAGVLTAGDLDVSSLSDVVRGYRISAIGALRANIEPLQGAWPFDVIQAGYQIRFKRRGVSSSVATIDVALLDARLSSEASGIRITKGREMDTQLPCRVNISHLDYSREYDTGDQYAERLNTASVNIQSIEMPIVLTAQEAAQKAEILLYMYWLERHDVSFSLPPSFGSLEPADVITITAPGLSYVLRLTSVNANSNGFIECTAKLNDAAAYTSSVLGVDGMPPISVIQVQGPSAYAVLDIPTLKDTYDTPGFIVAMCGYLPGWSGGTVLRSYDDGQTWSDINEFVTASPLGYGLSFIDAPDDARMIDKRNVLAAKIFSGALSSVTELQMLNGANHFAYGVDGRWEIIAAQNCVLQGDGSYQLSSLLRGRFGTEWAAGLHVLADQLVLLDEKTIQFSNSALNQIGLSANYRGISNNENIDSDNDLVFAYRGVNLECLSPVYLNGARHPTTNDWSLVWMRRTRVGGELRDYVDAALSETSEAYEVEIYSSAAYTTVKRTLTGLTTAAASYTSALQVTDFGSNQATLYLKIYQLSANVGRGTPLTTSITR